MLYLDFQGHRRELQRCMGSFMGISTWCLRVKQKCWCVVAFFVSLAQTRTFATGMLPATPLEWTMRCRGGKKRPRTLIIVLYLLPNTSGRGEATPWRKTLDALYKRIDGLLTSLSTRCMPTLMLDLNDSATRFRAFLRRHSIAVPQSFIWLHPPFMVRADDHESILLPHSLLCNSRASLSISRLEGGYS